MNTRASLLLLATWRPACFETGRCCPVRLCGLVACYERCVHKGERGKCYAERGSTNDRSSHKSHLEWPHGSDGMLFSRHRPARGCEERCRDRVQPNRLTGARPPQKRRTKIRQASEPVRQRQLTHTHMHLDMHLRTGSTIRFKGNESLACRRRALSRPSRAR